MRGSQGRPRSIRQPLKVSYVKALTKSIENSFHELVRFGLTEDKLRWRILEASTHRSRTSWCFVVSKTMTPAGLTPGLTPPSHVQRSGKLFRRIYNTMTKVVPFVKTTGMSHRLRRAFNLFNCNFIRWNLWLFLLFQNSRVKMALKCSKIGHMNINERYHLWFMTITLGLK